MRPVGMDVLGLDWGDVAQAGHVVNKVGGTIVNFYVPGAGTALANVVDERIDEAQGKKPKAPGTTAATGAPQPKAPGTTAAQGAPQQPVAPKQEEGFMSRKVVGPVRVWHAAAGACALGLAVIAARAS